MPPWRWMGHAGPVLLLVVCCQFRLLAQDSPPPGPPAPPAEFDPAHVEKMQEGLALFKSQVREILIQHCVDCHGGDQVESGFDLATRKGLIRGGAHGPAIVPGKSADSNVVRFISHRQRPFMPEGGDKLPADQIAAIARWIDLGAPYDRPLVENPRDPDSWVHTVVPDKAREFWSFRPLSRPEVPSLHDAGWCRNPIDYFILEKLQQRGMQPNGLAGRRTLLRRAYFDLIGLPPPQDEAERFLADDDPQAYEKLLDRLLDNPHFGERWARHWLDAARFAESHGFEQDYDRPFAYHFRDFVIEAFNQDMPYDQFVRWQLAGDELAPDNPLALKATGFLGAGVFPTQITANEVERTRYDALDDMASTMGSAMLGLSIGCARCHDHKFDPIPQADYYRLIATFTTTVRSNLDVELEPEKYRQAKEAFDREHQPLVAARQRYEREELPGRLAAWEQSDEVAAVRQTPWIVLAPTNLKSNGGATLTPLEDGSVLVSGGNPQTDWFTFSVTSSLPSIAALRLEALPDPSLPQGGSGRGPGGRFVLTDFRVRVRLPGEEMARELSWQSVQATAEAGKAPAWAAVDDKEETGWSLDAAAAKSPQALVLTLEKPLVQQGPQTLNIQMDFKAGKQQVLGRFRLSAYVGSADQPALPAPLKAGEGLPEAVLHALKLPREQRTQDQQATLLAWFRHRDAGWQALNAAVVEHAKKAPQPNLVKIMVCSEGVTPIRHHTQGADFFNETYFLKRGDCDQKMGVATQSFLQVLMTAPDRERHWQEAPPPGWRTSYRRRALAAWITDTEYGAGHLLARVIVNRLWHHHFGRGIVATPNDFGTQGAPPTHPELIDWLAQELIRGGWRLKPLHKLIMTSATYMQSSQYDPEDARRDPENVWLWRRTPQRLEAELIRDAILSVGGTLDTTMYGPGTLDEGHHRRSIYFMVKRSKLIPMMQLFDQPEPLVSVGARPRTTIAPQALALMNSPQIRAAAHAFAARLAPARRAGPAAAIEQAFLMALARRPDPEERTAALGFLETQERSYAQDGQPEAPQRALADFCQVLFGLNEFIYLD